MMKMSMESGDSWERADRVVLWLNSPSVSASYIARDARTVYYRKIQWTAIIHTTSNCNSFSLHLSIESVC